MMILIAITFSKFLSLFEIEKKVGPKSQNTFKFFKNEKLIGMTLELGIRKFKKINK